MNYQTISPTKLFNALKWLKANNSYYANVNILEMEEWIKQSEENDTESVLENLICDDPTVEKEYVELADLEEPDADPEDARKDLLGNKNNFILKPACYYCLLHKDVIFKLSPMCVCFNIDITPIPTQQTLP